jgi:integrase
MRASETVNLTEADLEGGTIVVRRGKGSNATRQPLQEHENPLLNEKAAVEAWLASRQDRGKKGGSKMRQSIETVANPRPARLFPISRGQFWRLVHGYALAVGIPRRKAKCHMLKHTIAKHLIRSGLPINEVQAWLGWKSLQTANWYLMADEDELGARVGQAIRGKDAFRQIQQSKLFPPE